MGRPCRRAHERQRGAARRESGAGVPLTEATELVYREKRQNVPKERTMNLEVTEYPMRLNFSTTIDKNPKNPPKKPRASLYTSSDEGKCFP